MRLRTPLLKVFKIESLQNTVADRAFKDRLFRREKTAKQRQIKDNIYDANSKWHEHNICLVFCKRKTWHRRKGWGFESVQQSAGRVGAAETKKPFRFRLWIQTLCGVLTLFAATALGGHLKELRLTDQYILASQLHWSSGAEEELRRHFEFRRNADVIRCHELRILRLSSVHHFTLI